MIKDCLILLVEDNLDNEELTRFASEQSSIMGVA